MCSRDTPDKRNANSRGRRHDVGRRVQNGYLWRQHERFPRLHRPCMTY